jgi:hypothetical protein
MPAALSSSESSSKIGWLRDLDSNLDWRSQISGSTGIEQLAASSAPHVTPVTPKVISLPDDPPAQPAPAGGLRQQREET